MFPNVVDPLTDIVVAASASTSATVPGDIVTVTIRAQNMGPQDATGVVLTVPLPSGATLEGTPPAGYDAGSGLWTIGALPNGGQAALPLTLRIADTGALAVTATRTAIDQIDQNAANDTATAALTSKPWSTFEADLVLTASTPAVIGPGAVLIYELVGVNRGPTYVLDLFIEGAVPPGTTFEAVAPSAGGVCSAPAAGSAGMVTCTWPGATLLDAGASRLAELQVRVPADATPGSSIIGAFRVGSQAAEYYEPSNNAVVTTAVSDGTTADLALSGLAAADWQVGPLGPGESATFDLTVAMHSMRATTLSMRRVDSLPGDPNSANDTAALILDGTGDPSGGERWTAIGNLDGAGLAEIIVGAGRLETPQVRIFTNGQDTGLRFYAYDRNFVGGVAWPRVMSTAMASTRSSRRPASDPDRTSAC